MTIVDVALGLVPAALALLWVVWSFVALPEGGRTLRLIGQTLIEMGVGARKPS